VRSLVLRGFFYVSLFTILLFVNLSSTAQEIDDAIDWDNASPSQIHQRMAEMKAAALADKMFVRGLADGAIAASTQTNYDVIFYDIDIRIDDTTETLFGVIKFVATAVGDGITQVEVDYAASMFIDSIVAPSGELSYSRNGDVVMVTLDGAYNDGEQFEFDFYYWGQPSEGGLQAFAFDVRSTGKAISSLSEPYFARSWWPCKDRMDDKADSFYIAITVDTSMYCASNGTLDSTVADLNAHTFYYSVGYPMVTYLFSVAVHNYTVWTDEWSYDDGAITVPLIHAVYPDWYVHSLTHYDVTPYAMTVFSDKWGLYPFVDEKYGHANFEWGGGMEHQTMTSMGGSEFGFSEPVVVHELSHQWWGDMITCESWSDIWLNEGWASYAEADYYLEKSGWFAYHNYMNDMAYTGGGTIYVYDTTNVWNIFHGGRSYDKGAWVVHMLRGVLGDELFYQGVDAYYHSEFQYGAAKTEDFRDVFEVATGVELDWFFEEWIYGTYRPNYEFSFYEEESPTDGWDVYLAVEQVQTTYPNTFTMPIDFSVSFNTEVDDTITVFVDERKQVFKLNFPQMVWNMDLDPSDWVLKYKSSVPWDFNIVTSNGDLGHGQPEQPYLDTIETRGAESTTTTLASGALPPGYTISSVGVISGTTTSWGEYAFTVRVDDDSSADWDAREFTLVVDSPPFSPGDVDQSEQVDVADLVFMVSWMFDEGTAPANLNLADVDGSCQNDIADLVYFVKYQFQDGPAPVLGCVE